MRGLLRLGCTEDASAEAERIGLQSISEDSADGSRTELAVARGADLWWAAAIDLLIATRRFTRADALVAREYRIAKDEGRAGRLVELSLARATLALQADDETGAGRALAAALRRAARRRIVRPFRDHAPLVATLVRS